ncbi:MAG: choice-of-anchor J domain-containing protein, partial [Prevotella sp.]|nr:choice-of-anchor J domain-containing protein [Prevotella sp.]
MSKKLTSFMVIAAAGLLSLPIQAQERVAGKVAPNGRNTIKSATLLNVGDMLKKNMLIQAIEKREADKAEFEKMWNRNIAAPMVHNTIRKAKVDVLPYVNDMTTEESFNQLTVIDANNDGATWAFLGLKKLAAYTWSDVNSGDDWLVTPGIKLEAGKSYEFGVELAAGLAAYPEKFEIKMAKAEDTPTADAMSAGTVIVPPTALNTEKFQTYGQEGMFVEETGYYYFGIHAITDAGMFYLYAQNIHVAASTITAESPSAPTVEVTAAEKGELKASVKVTAPALNVGGGDLGSNISKIDLYRDSILVKTFTDVAKGQVLPFDDVEKMTHGMHAYCALPYDAEGNAGMKSEKVSLYVGFDIPSLPAEMTVTDKSGVVAMKWSLVDTGVQNGYVDPAEIDYNLYTLTVESLWGFTYLVLDQPIGSVKNKGEYEYSGMNLDEGEQNFQYFGVQPQSIAGANGSFTSSYVLVGKPYDLPLIEGMEGAKFHTMWYSDGMISSLGLSSDATDGDGVALNFKMNAESEPGTGFLSTGKLNLNASAHPTLLFDAKKGSGNSNLAIYGSKDGGESEKIADVALKDDYTKFNVDLSSLKGSRYAQVRFVSNFTETT